MLAQWRNLGLMAALLLAGGLAGLLPLALQPARAALEEVTGVRTPDDVLAHVFARFCVGK